MEDNTRKILENDTARRVVVSTSGMLIGGMRACCKIALSLEVAIEYIRGKYPDDADTLIEKAKQQALETHYTMLEALQMRLAIYEEDLRKEALERAIESIRDCCEELLDEDGPVLPRVERGSGPTEQSFRYAIHAKGCERSTSVGYQKRHC